MIKQHFFFYVLLLLFTACKGGEQPVTPLSPTEPSKNSPSQLQHLASLFEQLKATIKAPPAPNEAWSFYGLTTELELGKTAPLLAGVPKGLFVTVGGDRAFQGAGLFKGIEGLVIFDLDPRTVRFNQINAKLLKAKDLTTYRYLRWDASLPEWLAFDNSLTEEDRTFWRTHVKNPSSLFALGENLNRYESDMVSQRFKTLHGQAAKDLLDQNWYNRYKNQPCPQLFQANPAEIQNDLIDAKTFVRYKPGNYLFDEASFQRLRGLALANKIFSIAADLKDRDNQDAIIKAFSKSALSVLDLDNTYSESYIGSEGYAHLVRGLLPSGQDASLLLTMTNNKDLKRYPKNQACAISDYSTYIGLTFDYIKKHPSILDKGKLSEAFTAAEAEFNTNGWPDIKLLH